MINQIRTYASPQSHEGRVGSVNQLDPRSASKLGPLLKSLEKAYASALQFSLEEDSLKRGESAQNDQRGKSPSARMKSVTTRKGQFGTPQISRKELLKRISLGENRGRR